MPTPKPDGAMWCVLLAALLSSIGAQAAVTDTKKPSKQQPVSAVADTQASARHQGAVNVSGINWACSGTHCNASTMPSAVAAPVTVCQGLARKVGVIRSFKVANRSLNGDELQRCNSVVPAVAAAKPGKAAKAPITGSATQAPITSDLTKKLPATNKANRKASPHPENWTGPDLSAGKSPVFGDMRNELRKNDQTAKPPAKKPSGAKDTTQASAQSDGKASSPPPAAEAKAPSSPVRLRTGRLTYTGSGSSVGPPVFSPVRLRTERLSYTGLGSASGPAPFTPVRMRTGTLTYTGSGGH